MSLNRISPYFSLFASFSTLICCALPAVFVALGMGASFATIVSNVPQLIWFSERKGIVFGIAGTLLAGSFLIQRYGAAQSCPTDPELARACMRGRRFAKITLAISCLLYLIGAFFAFAAALFFN